jgi:hypothetical protein
MASPTEEIAIRLGVKTGDLKAALADAGSDIKRFKKSGESGDDGLLKSIKDSTRSLRDFREIFLGGALANAVKGFFSLAIESANASSDATDRNAARVREFGKSLEEARGWAGKVAVAVIGFFNGIGEKIGDLQNMQLAFYRDGLAGVKEYQRQQAEVTATAKAAEEAERRVADLRKRYGNELVAISKEIATLTDKLAEGRQKALTPLQQEQDLLTRAVHLQDQLNAYDGEIIGKRRIQLEIARNALDLQEATQNRKKEEARLEREMADERKKNAEEIRKEEDEAVKRIQDRQKERALSKADEIELFTLQKKNRDTLTKAEKERLAVLELQKKEKLIQVQLDELSVKIITNEMTPADQKRLAELIKQQDAIRKQLEQKTKIADVVVNEVVPAEKLVTAEMHDQLRVAQMLTEETERQAQISRSRSGTIKQEGDVRNLNDVQLDELILKLNRNLAPIKQADSEYFGVGMRSGTYKSIEQLLLQQNLNAAITERNTRREFSNTVSFFGDERAQRNFAGGEYDRLSALFNPDLQKQQARDIAAMTQTLKNVFPEQFGGAR